MISAKYHRKIVSPINAAATLLNAVVMPIQILKKADYTIAQTR